MAATLFWPQLVNIKGLAVSDVWNQTTYRNYTASEQYPECQRTSHKYLMESIRNAWLFDWNDFKKAVSMIFNPLL